MRKHFTKLKTPSIVGLFLMIIAVLFLINFSNYLSHLINWLQENFGDDHELNKITVLCIQSFIGFLIFFMLVISVLLLTNSRKVFYKWVYLKTSKAIRFFIVPEDVKSFFLQDKSARLEKQNLWILLISSIVGFLLPFNILFFGLPRYEGTLENACAVILVLSVAILLFSVKGISNRISNSKEKRALFILILSISTILLIYLGEEISWGQHLFKWETSGVFKEHNYQGETNLHNFLNPILPMFYPLVGMTLFLILFLYWMFPRKELTMIHKTPFLHTVFL